MSGADFDSAAVFEAAQAATLRHTYLGRLARVTVEGVTYNVAVPERHLACIEMREHPGGVEYLTVSATPEQDRALRRAHGITAGR